MTQNPQENERPAVVPQITNEEADKIIDHFNWQFEEKVMKKVNAPASETVVGPGRQQGQGADLQDYLQTVRAELPNVPFADEDSKIDLSKLLDKRNNV